ATSFTDNTAAPCSTYFYKVEACDLCDKKTASAAMATAVGAPDPGESPDAPGGLNKATSVTGTTTAVSGNNYQITLNWPAVTRTAVSGRAAATAHYKVYRKVKLATESVFSLDTTGTNPIDVLETTGVAPLTVTDVQPDKRTGRAASYEYYVAAVYTGCGRESAWAGPYTASCTASNTITITVPAAGAEISIPFESGFTPQATVNGTGTITSATATITGPGSSSNVHWSSTKTGPGPTFTFDVFNTAPTLAVGTYYFNVYAIVDGCTTLTESRPIELGDATCGLSATNLTLTPSTGNPKFYQLSFNVQNTCDPTLGGLDFTVNGM